VSALAPAKRLARSVLGSRPARALLAAGAQRGDPIAMLCYHTLGADDAPTDAWTVLRASDFRAQVAALRESHEIVSLDAALAEGPGRPGRGRPRAVITFDDGEAGLGRHLLPVLEAERVPVAVHVATGQIESGRPYWFDRVMTALGPPRAVALDLAPDLAAAGLPARAIPAGGGAARWAAISEILEALKRLPPARREALADRIAEAAPPPPGAEPLGPLPRAALAALAAHPLVTIGAHSHCHGLLDQLPLAEAESSMARSRALLEAWTGRTVRHFAWPNGNHSPALRAAAARLGFASAAALGGGLWRRGADPFALPRIPVGRHDALARFRLRLLGI
jgi:peptidoglycan/xylan/chitin deacetylase (PgdA/CDA1 family)